jgi:hypothetical protein
LKKKQKYPLSFGVALLLFAVVSGNDFFLNEGKPIVKHSDGECRFRRFEYTTVKECYDAYMRKWYEVDIIPDCRETQVQ